MIELSPISINDTYRKKWNVSIKDFVFITKNGELVCDTLYRVGGFGVNITDDYFMLLKNVEAHYPDNITKERDKKPHLESRWVILDKNGIEKVEFEPYQSPYLVKDSCIYSINSNYYNIETGEFYCYSSHAMTSSEFLFLDSKFDKDETRNGVMKINKKDGSWEVIK